MMESIQADENEQTAERSPQQVVQFDLAQSMDEQQLQTTQFGRRRPPNDLCKDVKDAMVWDVPDNFVIGKSKKKTFDQVSQIQMERSPHKWKTMYRDQFRKFRQSPGKEVQVEAEE